MSYADPDGEDDSDSGLVVRLALLAALLVCALICAGIMVDFVFGSSCYGDDLAAVVVPAAPAATCHWFAGTFTGTVESTHTPQTPMLGLSAEGHCAVQKLGLTAFSRADGDELPGVKTAPTVQNISAGQVWVGLRKHVYGPLSIAALYGYQFPLVSGKLGQGGSAQSYGGGVWLDVHGAYLSADIVSRYAAIEMEPRATREHALVGTFVLPLGLVAGVQTASKTNFAYGITRHEQVVETGVLASWGTSAAKAVAK